MKRTISLFTVLTLASLLAIGGNVLASDDQGTNPVVAEQAQEMVEEGKIMAEEPSMQEEKMQKEGEEAVETMKEEIVEEVKEMASPADK